MILEKNSFSLKRITIMCTVFASIVLTESIVYKFFFDVSEVVTLFLHFARIIIDFLFFYSLGLSFKTVFKKRKIDGILLILCAFIGLCINFLANAIDSVIMLIFPIGESAADDRSTFFLIYLALYVITIAPVFEEIEYRLLLFRGLFKNTKNLIFSVLFSALMFFAIHSGSINSGALILGMVSAVIFYLTDHIIYSIVMHCSGNLIGSMLILYSIGTSQNAKDVVLEEEVMTHSDIIFNFVLHAFFGLFSLTVLIGLIAIALFRIKKKHTDCKIKIDDTYASVMKKDGSFVFILLYFLICIGDWIVLMM